MTAPDLRKLDVKFWPRDWFDAWQERAAIVEDGCMCSREEAERSAREIVIRQWEREAKHDPA